MPEASFLTIPSQCAREGGRWIAFATPFVNMPWRVPAPRQAPLWRVFAIEQSPHDAIVELSPVAQCTTIPGNLVAPLPGIKTGSLLDLASDIAANVTVSKLLRTRDGSLSRCFSAHQSGAIGHASFRFGWR